MRASVLLIAFLAATPALAAKPTTAPPARCEGVTDFKVPRFASLKSGKAYMRAGPEDRFPIQWTYVRKGLPIEILREYCVWREVRDPDGTIGWMNKSQLAGDRTVIATGSIRSLYVSPDLQSRIAFRAEPGAVLRVMLCDQLWCRVSSDGRSGYILRDQSWGSYPNEAVGG